MSERVYHIYLKDGGKLSFTNFFAFYLEQENCANNGDVKFLTVEEPWVDLPKECMKIIESKMAEASTDESRNSFE